MRRLLGIVWFVAAMAGFLSGFVDAQRAHATTTYTIQIMGGADAYMNCGWHGSCGPTPTAGSALDWRRLVSHAIYFRSFMYKDSGSPSTVAQGTVELRSPSTCKTVWLHISSPAGQTYRGTQWYVHSTTTASGATIDIVGSTSGYWTQSQVGSTATSENDACTGPDLWQSEHLHEYAYWENVASSSTNTAYFPGYVNAQAKDIDVQGHHQDSASWSY